MVDGTDTRPGRTAGHFFLLVGMLIIVSSIVVNPWTGKFWRKDIINYSDAMLSYFSWSCVLGCLIAGAGFLAGRTDARLPRNVAALFMALSLVILPDRLLLAKYGRRLFVPDVQNRYRYRPNVVKCWGPELGNNLISINQYGYRDDDFPIKKPDNEFRVLVLGDSVVMGHGVSHEETFCTQLESLLASRNSGRTCKVINAGIQGYATRQECNIMKETLAFEPDVVFLGFCMNDVTEPFVTDRELGGVGVDYLGMAQTSGRLLNYISNETGYGRLAEKIRDASIKAAIKKREETYNVGYMAGHPRDPAIEKAWNEVLSDLELVYSLGREKNIKVVLLIFPYTFQLAYRSLLTPQETLLAHAREHKVDVIDLTPAFEHLVSDKNASSTHSTAEEIAQATKERARRYFFDENHLTPEGHKVVAEKLCNYLDASAPRPQSALKKEPN